MHFVKVKRPFGSDLRNCRRRFHAPALKLILSNNFDQPAGNFDSVETKRSVLQKHAFRLGKTPFSHKAATLAAIVLRLERGGKLRQDNSVLRLSHGLFVLRCICPFC